MIDTIRLATRDASLPPCDELEAHGFTMQYGKSRRGAWMRAWFNPPASDGSLPRLTWTHTEHDRRNMVIVEMSLANFWRRRSGCPLSDDHAISAALDAASLAASAIARADLNLRTMLVRRVDFYEDFPVGDAVRSYLTAAATATPARMRLVRFGNSSTVYFQNATRVLAAYDKFKEISLRRKQGKATDWEVAESRGLLRIEHRLMSARACTYHARRIGCTGRSAGHLLSAKASEFFVNEALGLLGLNRSVWGGDERATALVTVFGRNAAEMAGMLLLREVFGEDFWRKLKWSHPTFSRKRSLLQRAGFWNSSPTSEELPALHLIKGEGRSKVT